MKRNTIRKMMRQNWSRAVSNKYMGPSKRWATNRIIKSCSIISVRYDRHLKKMTTKYPVKCSQIHHSKIRRHRPCQVLVYHQVNWLVRLWEREMQKLWKRILSKSRCRKLRLQNQKFLRKKVGKNWKVMILLWSNYHQFWTPTKKALRKKKANYLYCKT